MPADAEKKNALTRQPNQGRSAGGALRFGEMEKNTAGSHACPGFIQDRMLHNSDKHTVYVCPECKQPALKEGCPACNTTNTKETDMVYAGSLLFQELKSMCIKTNLHT